MIVELNCRKIYFAICTGFIHSLGGRIRKDSEMLTDKHISAVNSLLEKQFPQIESLKTPLLLQNGSFKPISHEGGFFHDRRFD